MSFQYKKFPDGSWTIVGPESLTPGAQATVTTRNGKTKTEIVVTRLLTLEDGRHVYRIERKEPKVDPKGDLLAALKALTEWGCTHTRHTDANSPHALLIAAREAIAKAEGVAP